MYEHYGGTSKAGLTNYREERQPATLILSKRFWQFRGRKPDNEFACAYCNYFIFQTLH